MLLFVFVWGGGLVRGSTFAGVATFAGVSAAAAASAFASTVAFFTASRSCCSAFRFVPRSSTAAERFENRQSHRVGGRLLFRTFILLLLCKRSRAWAVRATLLVWRFHRESVSKLMAQAARRRRFQHCPGRWKPRPRRQELVQTQRLRIAPTGRTMSRVRYERQDVVAVGASAAAVGFGAYVAHRVDAREDLRTAGRVQAREGMEAGVAAVGRLLPHIMLNICMIMPATSVEAIVGTACVGFSTARLPPHRRSQPRPTTDTFHLHVIDRARP